MKRILVVDDSAAARALVAAVLAEAADLQVERVSTGLEAIKLLSTTQIDLVLADVHMPEINGLELIRFIKDDPSLSRIPVVIVSTEAAEQDRLRGLSLGADDYLAKPFTAEQLRRVINKHLLR
ncbi:MAG: response regulator [Pyrinomonadaceae bacterium]